MFLTRRGIRLFPLIEYIRGYNKEKARGDMKSAFSVFLLDFPQAMAYALLGGFPVSYGVYASAVGSLVGSLFTGSRYLVLGPTNGTAVLIFSALASLNLSGVDVLKALPILVFMVGLLLMVGGFLGIASLVKYISRSVVTGYVSGVGLMIMANQIGAMLGLENEKGTSFLDVMWKDIRAMGSMEYGAVILSVVTGIIYWTVVRLDRNWPRVALSMIGGSLVGYVMTRYLGIEFGMVEAFSKGEGGVGLWWFNFDLIAQLGGPALALGFLVMLESTTVSKNLAAKAGGSVDVNQQIFGIGVANTCCAFTHGMVVSGSLVRSRINIENGAQTPFSCFFNGILLLAGTVFLNGVLPYIPRPVLATVVMFVGVELLDLNSIKVIIRSTRTDAIVFLVTFGSGLVFPLSMAICLGAVVSIILFLNRVSEPQLVHYSIHENGDIRESGGFAAHDMPEISIVHVEGELFFGSTDIFLEQMRMIYESKNLKVVILRLRNATNLDATSAMAIMELVEFAKEKGRTLIISGANEQIEGVFEETGVIKRLGRENFFRYNAENPNLSTRDALKRAQEVIGEGKANIVILAK